MISHNALSVWRVVLTRGDVRYWWIVFGNTLIIAEGVIVVKRNGGTEWKWYILHFLSDTKIAFRIVMKLQILLLIFVNVDYSIYWYSLRPVAVYHV